MKGTSLTPGQVVVLDLDGTLVYVEGVEATHANVVALPEQPTERADDRVFTPGRVGAKKISPFSTAAKVVPTADLSDRNKTFIGTYEQLRVQHGNNHVDRTPEEQAAHDAKLAGPPPKAKRVQLTPEEKAQRKADKKAAKASSGPRYLQRCTQCGEQPAHPCHGVGDGLHEFVAPAPVTAAVVLCLACDKPEEGHTAEHKFIAGKPQRAPKELRVPAVKAPRAAKPSKAGTDVNAKHRWVGDTAAYELLVRVNPKFSDKNSGGAIVAAVKAAGTNGISITDVMGELARHPRWCSIPVDRLQLAFGQMLGANLIEVA